MPLLTVGVAVYGAEDFIEEFLSSLARQTFADFECLLVDDGSPDGCGAICDAWAKKDGRFRVFHKENGGEASAWRVAIQNARGRWLTLMDDDDQLAPFALETILKQQARTPRSMVLWRWSSRWEDLKAPADPPAVTHLGPANMGRMYLDSLLYYTWGRLFDMELLRAHALLPRLIVYGDDLLFCMDYARTALAAGVYDDFALLEEPLYWYRDVNPGSLTARLRPSHCADELLVTEYLLDFWAAQPGIPAGDYHLCLLHRLRTMAEGLGYLLVSGDGEPAARRKQAAGLLRDERFARLLTECRAQKLYSPYLFWLRRGMLGPVGWLYRLKAGHARWFHRVYWAGYWLHTALTGQKSPLLF